MEAYASLPVFGKFLGKSEVVKPAAKLRCTTKMPEWVLINKMMFSKEVKK